MKACEQASLLRIFIAESDRLGNHPLYESIVLKAREMGLAGATVLRRAMDYGHSSRLHTTKILRLSEDRPVVIEIVDSEPMINRFVSAIEPMAADSRPLCSLCKKLNRARALPRLKPI